MNTKSILLIPTFLQPDGIKPLIFQTLTLWPDIIQCKKNQRSTRSGCKDTEIRKVEFLIIAPVWIREM